MVLCAFFILNSQVSYYQGINYRVRIVKIPLYLKVIDFFSRHYNYKITAEEIIAGSKSDKEKAVRLLKWTQENIRPVPPGLPLIDDHVWHIIIRGYGTDDQFQDVFTTLCNYAELDGFFCWINSADNKQKKPFSFVRLKRGWTFFDAYRGVYFKNSKQEIANINDLLANNWHIVSISNRDIFEDYGAYFKSLRYLNYENCKLSRAAIQSPFKRFLFWNKNKKYGL